MPIYDFACDDCGGSFEKLLPIAGAPDLECPNCGSRLRRRPAARVALLGRARTPPPASAAPTSWLGTRRGNPEFVTAWRRTLEERAKLEERHPELAQPRPVVLAHEGPYHGKPLTREDVAHAPAHTHGHPVSSQGTEAERPPDRT